MQQNSQDNLAIVINKQLEKYELSVESIKEILTKNGTSMQSTQNESNTEDSLLTQWEKLNADTRQALSKLDEEITQTEQKLTAQNCLTRSYSRLNYDLSNKHDRNLCKLNQQRDSALQAYTEQSFLCLAQATCFPANQEEGINTGVMTDKNKLDICKLIQQQYLHNKSADIIMNFIDQARQLRKYKNLTDDQTNFNYIIEDLQELQNKNKLTDTTIPGYWCMIDKNKQQEFKNRKNFIELQEKLSNNTCQKEIQTLKNNLEKELKEAAIEGTKSYQPTPEDLKQTQKEFDKLQGINFLTCEQKQIIQNKLILANHKMYNKEAIKADITKILASMIKKNENIQAKLTSQTKETGLCDISDKNSNLHNSNLAAYLSELLSDGIVKQELENSYELTLPADSTTIHDATRQIAITRILLGFDGFKHLPDEQQIIKIKKLHEILGNTPDSDKKYKIKKFLLNLPLDSQTLMELESADGFPNNEQRENPSFGERVTDFFIEHGFTQAISAVHGKFLGMAVGERYIKYLFIIDLFAIPINYLKSEKDKLEQQQYSNIDKNFRKGVILTASVLAACINVIFCAGILTTSGPLAIIPAIGIGLYTGKLFVAGCAKLAKTISETCTKLFFGDFIPSEKAKTILGKDTEKYRNIFIEYDNMANKMIEHYSKNNDKANKLFYTKKLSQLKSLWEDIQNGKEHSKSNLPKLKKEYSNLLPKYIEIIPESQYAINRIAEHLTNNAEQAPPTSNARPIIFSNNTYQTDFHDKEAKQLEQYHGKKLNALRFR